MIQEERKRRKRDQEDPEDWRRFTPEAAEEEVVQVIGEPDLRIEQQGDQYLVFPLLYLKSIGFLKRVR
ncbi:MAG: hypothetical protein ACFFEK_03625 [Candidatus Thorarchaeota archaeon]